MALGSNASSKLGLTSVATNSYTSTPTIIPTLTSIEDIACGPDFALACDQSGALWTWGNNATGATGRGTIVGTTTIPTGVDSSVWNNDKVVAVAAGESHAVIITQSLGGLRRVFTAGSNLYGQPTQYWDHPFL
jgi:alpha-tubulin suppressor-like RCC1 family protein